ncbi:hypothetical protein ABEB36_000159 [Hypothenemus hampei]|uniref:MADF domain-containing protein n=1 Tax=Hypothenemus hampei TaxID=57062 RepID=A0ABD1FAE0_HYPHA
MENFEELLINYVEQSPHLYNKSSKYYKDEWMKHNTWASIAMKLESEPEKVKKRWENLRSNFVRAYRIYNEKPPSGSAAIAKKITFPYFMLWLAPYIRKENEMDEIYEIPFSSASTSLTTPLSSASNSGEIPHSKEKVVKSKKSDLSTTVDAFTTLVAYKTNVSTQKAVTDPADEAFLRSIILDMGKIKPEYRIEFKCEVMQLLYNSGLNDLP